MAKRYLIFEEDAETGSRVEVGQADSLHIDDQAQAHAGGWAAPATNAPARPVQIEAGNQVITITIQIAPAHQHHPHNHGHGGCADCNRQR